MMNKIMFVNKEKKDFKINLVSLNEKDNSRNTY